MPSSFLAVRIVAAAVACAALLVGCGSNSSYAATEQALRDWLDAVESADPSACALETPEYQDELLTEHLELGGPGTGCAERIGRMSGLDLPPARSKMDVPVWDPAGEALVEVTDPETGAVRKFWMVYEGDRWLVAGEAD